MHKEGLYLSLYMEPQCVFLTTGFFIVLAPSLARMFLTRRRSRFGDYIMYY